MRNQFSPPKITFLSLILSVSSSLEAINIVLTLFGYLPGKNQRICRFEGEGDRDFFLLTLSFFLGPQASSTQFTSFQGKKLLYFKPGGLLNNIRLVAHCFIIHVETLK